MKYSNRGLFDEKGIIYPLFERLYFIVVSFFILFVLINLLALIATNSHMKKPNAKYSTPFIDSCLNQSSAGDFTINRNSFIVRCLEGVVLVLTSIMYASIMYKMRGRKIFNSRFYSYKKNILTLKETFILEIANELFTLVFVFLVDHLNYFVSYCILYSIYCIILYFLLPMLLLFSLQKTLPEFYVVTLNSPNKTTEIEFYAICKPVNLEPRNSEFIITIQDSDAESQITENFQKFAINVNIPSVSHDGCQLPKIE